MQEPQELNALTEAQSIEPIEEPINHFTIDIETLGLQPNAVVLSIGCIKWNMRDGITGEFHVPLDLLVQAEKSFNRSFTPETIDFWIDQPRNYGLGGVEKLHPYDACGDLREFILPFWTPKKSTVWAQGPNFDITILDFMFFQLGLKSPWEYNSVRDARTLWKLFPTVTNEDNLHKHNALEDARTETKNVMNILRALKGTYGFAGI